MVRAHYQNCNPEWRAFALAAGVIAAGLALGRPVFANDMRVDSHSLADDLHNLAELPPAPPPPGLRIAVDHSGRREEGKASIYSHSFDGRRMADGRRYDPHANLAASRSLPLGTTARVTNLRTGKSTEVRIEDRGPFVSGRVVDLTPRAAQEIGLTEREGLTRVIVAPIAVPQPDGRLKPGAGAAETETASTR
jgi:rare lipoprotein A